ncbi:MAG: FGGY family carbohydrate kinase [Acidimicrobiales bacterium]
MVRALAIDIGTTILRTGIVDTSGNLTHTHQHALSVRTPNPGEVELDAREIAHLTLELARRTIADGGECDVVGITNQRASTIVFDPSTGEPVGPTLGWQDLRTVIDCLVLQGEGLRLAPNQSATKAQWLVRESGRAAKELRFATIETWVTWHLTGGDAHVSDHSNAGVTGLVNTSVDQWDERALDILGLDIAMMPTLVDTMGEHGVARVLPGSPRITALIGDQPASLFGQCCITRGTKITFGTGAMLDTISGLAGPSTMTKFASGCFPIVGRSQHGTLVWGIEGIVLAAGSCIEWLRDDLGLIESPSDTEVLALSVESTNGVWFVPALSGLGTPQWDFGARGGFFGITRGTTKAHMVRAVLEGIAHRGADLVDAAQQQIGSVIEEIRVDGGMTANTFFVQALANYTGVPVTVSPQREATTRGAGLMALVGAGHLSLEDVEHMWAPERVLMPQFSNDHRLGLRAAWREQITRVEKTIPELSAVEF